MDNDDCVTVTGVMVAVSVILACLIMLQLTAITYLAKLQLSTAVVAITDYIDNECTGE